MSKWSRRSRRSSNRRRSKDFRSEIPEDGFQEIIDVHLPKFKKVVWTRFKRQNPSVVETLLEKVRSEIPHYEWTESDLDMYWDLFEGVDTNKFVSDLNEFIGCFGDFWTQHHQELETLITDECDEVEK